MEANASAGLDKRIRSYGKEISGALWFLICISLPVRSLLMVACVNKRLFSLIKYFIQDPLFIKKNLQFQKMMSKKNGQLVLQYEHLNIECNCLLFDEESITGTKAVPNRQLCHFYNGEGLIGNFKIHGPVNGLYCLHNTQSRFVIWNPATNEVGFLPPPEECLPDCPPYYGSQWLAGGFIGFGTDPLDDEDYKVILISTCEYSNSDDADTHCMLYTTKTNTWRLLKDGIHVDYYLCESHNNTYLNGSYYWKGQTRGTAYVFDMNKHVESFREISIPSTYGSGELALHNDQIYLFCVDKDRHGIDIWVMGDESDWSRRASVRGLEMGRVVRPLGFWKTENELLFIIDEKKEFSLLSSSNHYCQAVLYDTTTQKTWKFGPKGLSSSFKALGYYESLVSLTGGIIKYRGKDRASLLDNIWCFFEQDWAGGVYEAPPKPWLSISLKLSADKCHLFSVYTNQSSTPWRLDCQHR